MKKLSTKSILIIVCSAVLVVFLAAFASVYGKIYEKDVKIVEESEENEEVEDQKELTKEELSKLSIDDLENLLKSLTPQEKERLFDEEFLAEEDEVKNKYNEDIIKKQRIDKNILNILVIGQDSRPNEVRARSDSMMLVSYNFTEKKVFLTSFLRDIWTNIKGYGWYKLNTAYALGGPGLLINTLNENYGLDIQNYVVVDFNGLVEIVDTIGGLELNISKEEADFETNRFPDNPPVPFGENVTLTGAQVLGHAQNRYIGDNDFERTRRQRDIALAFYNKMKEIKDTKTILNLINESMENVKTNMNPADIISLSFEGLSIENMEISQAKVPFDGTWKYGEVDGQSVVLTELDDNEKLLNEFIYNK